MLVDSAHQQEEARHGAENLCVVMVDAPGPELAHGSDRCGGKHGRASRRPSSAAAERLAHDQDLQDGKQCQRPEHARQQFAEVLPQQRPQDADQRGEGQIDQPRPVRDERIGRADARQRRIKPGGSLQQRPHADEAQRIVGIAQPIAQRRSVAGQSGDRHKDDRCRSPANR